MARKKKTDPYIIGVYGSGPSNRRAINRMMPQRTDGHDAVEMVFLVDALWNDPIDNVLTWAEENTDGVYVVVDPEDEFVEDIADSATITIIEAGENDQFDAFIDALGNEGELVILWDEEDETNQDAITEVATAAADKGFQVFDLSFGMREVDFQGGDDEDAAVDEAEDEEASEQEDEVLKALEACTTPKAAEQLLTKDLERDDVVAIAESMDIEVKPRVRQTTLAAAIVEKMEEDGAFEKKEAPKKSSSRAEKKSTRGSAKKDAEEVEEDEKPKRSSRSSAKSDSNGEAPSTVVLNLTINVDSATADALVALADLVRAESK